MKNSWVGEIRIRRRSLTAPLGIKEFITAGLVMTKAFYAKHSVISDYFYHILLYLFPVISDSVIPNSLGSYMRIRYIRFQFWVITVSVISDSVILVSIISDSYLVISDSL